MDMDNLRRIRKEKKITQKQLAEKIGVQPSAISKYETGKVSPTIEQLEKIAEVLEVPVMSLFPQSVIDLRDIVGENANAKMQENQDIAEKYPFTEEEFEEVSQFFTENIKNKRFTQALISVARAFIGKSKFEFYAALGAINEVLDTKAKNPDSDNSTE